MTANDATAVALEAALAVENLTPTERAVLACRAGLL